VRVTTTLAISGSPSRQSKSRRLLDYAVERLGAQGIGGTVLDLCDLPADDLLGRTTTPAIGRALAGVSAARILLVGTPVYRASFSGLLKVFFDLLPPDALSGKVALPMATGGGPAHALVIDHALRPLLASVGALVVPTGVYGTDSQFTAAAVDAALLARVDRGISDIEEVIRHEFAKSAAV
jgi:FMN reductase